MLGIRIGIANEPYTSRSVWRGDAVTFSFSLRRQLLRNVTPLVFVLMTPTVTTVNAPVLRYLVWVSVNDRGQLPDNVVQLCRIEFLTLITQVMDITRNPGISKHPRSIRIA